MIAPPYTYRAEVRRVIDGDTVAMDVDLGLNTWAKNQSMRLLDVHAPEMVGSDKINGMQAKTALAEKLPVGIPVVITTHKDKNDKYGRLLVEIYTLDGTDVNDWMRKNAPSGGR